MSKPGSLQMSGGFLGIGACIDRGFASLAVPYLTAMIHPDNERSIRVARRLGLSPLRADVLLDTPVVVHVLTHEDWPSTDVRRGLVAPVRQHDVEVCSSHDQADCGQAPG